MSDSQARPLTICTNVHCAGNPAVKFQFDVGAPVSLEYILGVDVTSQATAEPKTSDRLRGHS